MTVGMPLASASRITVLNLRSRLDSTKVAALDEGQAFLGRSTAPIECTRFPHRSTVKVQESQRPIAWQLAAPLSPVHNL